VGRAPAVPKAQARLAADAALAPIAFLEIEPNVIVGVCVVIVVDMRSDEEGRTAVRPCDPGSERHRATGLLIDLRLGDNA